MILFFNTRPLIFSFALVGLTHVIAILSASAADTKQSVECDVNAEIIAADQPFSADTLKEVWKTSRSVRMESGLAFSHDGTRIVACLPKNGYIVFDGRTGKVLYNHEQPLSAPIVHVAVSRNGKHAALGLENRTVVIVDLEQDQIVHTHPATKTPLVGVHISEDNNRAGWFEENLTFHSASLKGGELLEATYPDELKTPPHSDSEELDSKENLIHPKQIYSVIFRGDGLTAMITPTETATTYGEVYLPANGQPSRHVKRPMFTGGLRAHELCPKYVSMLDAGGGVTFWTRTAKPVYFESTTRLTGLIEQPLAMGMSSQEGIWYFLVGKAQVEIRSLDIPSLPLIYHYSVDSPRQIALAPDGKRFAVVDGQGFLKVFALPTPAMTPGWRFARLVRKVALNKQYEKLDEFFEKLNQRETAFPWHSHMHDYNLLFHLIENPSPWTETPIDIEAYAKDWLRERPDSEFARIVQIEPITARGWEARGTYTADTVTPEGWKMFVDAHRDAFKLLSPILEKDRPSPLAFYDVVAVAQAEGWSQAKLRPYLTRLEKLYPHDVFTHQLVVTKLAPKWGGKPRASVKYAQEMADKRGPGAGDALYAYLALAIAHDNSNEEVFSDFGFDYHRVQKGWRYMQEHDIRKNRGVLGELLFASIQGDTPRLKTINEQILQNNIPFEFSIFDHRSEYQQILSDHLKQKLKAQ